MQSLTIGDMMRIPLVAGNWKMYTTRREAVDLISVLRREIPTPRQVEVAVFPPFTALADVGRALQGTEVQLGAQDMFWEVEGPFTGEVAPRMLIDVGCRYVIVGHSERRRHFAETDAVVARKVQAGLAHHLVPIVCVGEHLEEREAGKTHHIVSHQVRAVLAELSPEKMRQVVIAYEPIWAIGTGRSARGDDANQVIGGIRRAIAERFPEAASQVRILYGGSVTPESIGEFTHQPEIDGALVGGASLDAAKFAAIVRAVGASSNEAGTR